MADEPLHITDRVQIPGSDLETTFARASGPGGQHVNTTDSAVRLRFDLAGSTALREPVKARIREARPSWVNADGSLLVTSARFRSQLRNIDDAREKLAELIREHLTPPKPRRPTKPSKSAKRKRVDAKKKRGDLKAGRGRIRHD